MTHFKWTAAALAVMFSVLGCDSAVSPRVADSAKNGNTSPWDWPTIPVPARVVVAISPEELTLGNSGTATATALNETGGILAASAVTWSVEDSSVATVDANGLVRGTAVGSTRIVATISGVVGSAAVTVVSAPIAPLVTVASVTVSLTQTVLSQDETASGTATARDATGNVVNGQMVSWNSSNPRVATVTSLGVVAAISPGTASITATVAGVVGAATLLVSAPDPGFANNSPSPGHPNEPAGFVTFNNQPWDVAMRAILTGEIDRTRSAVRRIEGDIAGLSDPDRHRIWGEAILAGISELRPLIRQLVHDVSEVDAIAVSIALGLLAGICVAGFQEGSSRRRVLYAAPPLVACWSLMTFYHLTYGFVILLPVLMLLALNDARRSTLRTALFWLLQVGMMFDIPGLSRRAGLAETPLFANVLSHADRALVIVLLAGLVVLAWREAPETTGR